MINCWSQVPRNSGTADADAWGRRLSLAKDRKVLKGPDAGLILQVLQVEH